MKLTDFPELREGSVVENTGERYVVIEITGTNTVIVDPVGRPGYGEEVYLFKHGGGVVFMDPFSLRDADSYDECVAPVFKIVKV